MAAQRSPDAVGNFVVAGDDRGGTRFLGQHCRYAILAEIHETLRMPGRGKDGFQLVFVHPVRVAIESAVNPRIGDVSAESDPAVTFLDKVVSGPKGSFEVIKAHLVETILPVHSHNVVAEGNKRHVDGFDSAKKVRI